MRGAWWAVLVAAALVLAGCGAPPTADVQAQGGAGGEGSDDTGASAGTASPDPATAKPSSGSKTSSATGKPKPSATASATSSRTQTASASSTATPTPPPTDGRVYKVLPPQTPSLRDWGEPKRNGIRPGMDTAQDGSGCTANFLYHLNDERYFIGLAAHCFQTGGNPVSQACPTDNNPLGTPVTLYAPDGTEYPAKLAYSSYLTMQELGETDGDICEGNDFALAEIDPSALHAAHPAVRFYGGPTRPMDADELEAGDTVYDYGNSDLRSAYELVPTPQTNPHEGEFLAYDYGGWEVVTRFVPPTVQGDSGSGLLGPGGEAVGALSSGSITYTEEQFTNIAFALRYMHDRLGWAPSVVTWPEFDPAGIEDP